MFSTKNAKNRNQNFPKAEAKSVTAAAHNVFIFVAIFVMMLLPFLFIYPQIMPPQRLRPSPLNLNAPFTLRVVEPPASSEIAKSKPKFFAV